MFEDDMKSETSNYYGSDIAQQAGMIGAMEIQPPTTRKQLEQRQQKLMAQLARVNEALAALNQYPDLEKFMETIKAAQR